MSARLRRFVRHPRGFTLVELMAVVVVIAVLIAFAVPNYTRYGIRARRVDAQQALLRIADAQERYYATHNLYGKKLADLGVAQARSEKGYYRLSVRPTSMIEGFTAIATPVSGGPQARDDCGALYIDHTGVKGNTGGATTNGSCW